MEQKRSLKLLFVNPPSPSPDKVVIRDTNRSGRISSEGTIWPQTGLAMMASLFPDDDVWIIDCIAEKISYPMLYAKMIAFWPDWVIFNPISSTFTNDMLTLNYAHSLGAKTAIISPLAEHQKEEVYGRYPNLSYIIRYWDGLVEPEIDLYRRIKGTDPVVKSFADYPPSRQDLLPLEKYRLPIIGDRYTFVIASRGCPYRCIYCRQNATWGNHYRARSIDSIREELTRYNLKNVAFHSDTFTLDKKWVAELCRAIPNGIRWICNSRVDTVDEGMLREMKAAGCWMVCFGIESGNDKVLALNRKGQTCEQSERAVRAAKSAGLKTWGYFMLGLYGDTRRTMEETIKFSLRLPLDVVNFSVSAPYHGTEWNSIARRNGWLTDETWESYDQNYSAIVNQPGCSPEIVRRLQKTAYRKWYGSWRGLNFAARWVRPRDAWFWVKRLTQI